MSFAAVAPGVFSFRGCWPRKGGEKMRNAIWVACAVLVAACGYNPSTPRAPGASPDAGATDTVSVDASMLADVWRLDLQRQPDAVAVDGAIVSADTGVGSVEAGRMDAWGRVDDAGVLYCEPGYYDAVKNRLSNCGGVFPGGSCYRDLDRRLPATCRWHLGGDTYVWVVRFCGDCDAVGGAP